MPNRSFLGGAAASLAALAAAVSYVDGEAAGGGVLQFFIALTVVGAIGTVAVREPYRGRRRVVARAIGAMWLAAGGYIGVLLLWQQAVCGCSYPAPTGPEATYLGLPASAFHLAGVFGGGALMAVAAFSRRLR